MQVMSAIPLVNRASGALCQRVLRKQCAVRQHHIDDVGDRLLGIGIVRNRADDGGLRLGDNAAGDGSPV